MKEATQKKILIIEDEKPLSHALSLKFEHEGFLVTATGSGEEAKEFLSKETYDLVLTDLIIPGVDGFSILELIKEKKMKTPVIVMTNLNQEEDKKKVFDLGAVDYFVKSSISISEIVTKVKERAVS